MVLSHRNSVADGLRMTDMSVYNEDSTGKRIQWARKHAVWTDSDGRQQIGMTGHQLGRRLVTQGTASGVRNVYVSQLENNHASPSLPMLRKIAEVTGVTVGFLLMETDHPYPVKGVEPEPEPVYFSPEADTVARLVDDVPPEERARFVAVVRALAETVKPADKTEAKEASHLIAPVPATSNSFTRRLIESDRIGRVGNIVNA